VEPSEIADCSCLCFCLVSLPLFDDNDVKMMMTTTTVPSLASVFGLDRPQSIMTSTTKKNYPMRRNKKWEAAAPV
jgi:hypothetical protein